ncbi:MAG TPA: TatD family hydrolase [Solirubrobacterales bacterium]|nr:TatD family hydrolase [Solirubrobacterales bacterium]
MIDSHTHLFLCERPEAEVVAAAREAGVERMLDVGLEAESNLLVLAAAKRHETVFASVGCHPTEAAGFDDARAEEIARLAAENEKVRAIGETGIDYYRKTASRAEQRRAFEAQIEIARERKLPIVIHARDPEGETGAVDEVFSILDERGEGVEVILHCFLATWRVQDAIERGWYCSFSGVLTFPSAEELRGAAAELPDELLLVETDAPYLAPQSMRGKANEPAYVVSTAEVVAETRGVSYDELEQAVEANARTLFDW